MFEHVVEHVVAIGVSRVRQMQKAECYPCIRKRKMGGEWRLFMAPMPRVYTYYYYLQEHLPVDTISIATRNFFFQLFLFDNGIKLVPLAVSPSSRSSP